MDSNRDIQKESLIAHLKSESYLHSKKVEDALRRTPRDLFIPKEMEPHAYSDHPLIIGSGQTISAPHMVAIMTELLQPAKADAILEIVTGSGYQAAVLSLLVRKVYTVEFFPELASSAKHNLSKAGIRNVEVIQADGSKGLPEKAPYDKIIVTCSITMDVFDLLGKQLKEGGTIIAPIGEPHGVQMLTAGRRAHGTLKKTEHMPCVFVPLRA